MGGDQSRHSWRGLLNWCLSGKMYENTKGCAEVSNIALFHFCWVEDRKKCVAAANEALSSVLPAFFISTNL